MSKEMPTLKQILDKKAELIWGRFLKSDTAIECVKEWLQQKHQLWLESAKRMNENPLLISAIFNELLEELEQ